MSRAGYTMRTPCADCPFRRPSVLCLHPDRIREIAAAVAPKDGQGGPFPCHKTTGAGGAEPGNEVQCAGALMFCEKQDRSTQLMRIAERLGLYDRTQLTDASVVWDDVDEWIKGGAC